METPILHEKGFSSKFTGLAFIKRFFKRIMLVIKVIGKEYMGGKRIFLCLKIRSMVI